MSVNDLDSFIDNFETYAQLFKNIVGRNLTYEEWVQIREYVKNKHKIKPPIVEWKKFKEISDSYEAVFIGYNAEHVHVEMLVRIIWANHVGIITNTDLDVMNQMWRKAC